MDLYGVRSRAQLIADGVPATTIDDRCRRGTYSRLLPRTYLLGDPTGLARCAAIVTWIPAAVLSHRTAGWLHNMLPEPAVFEATVPTGVHRRCPKWLALYRRDLTGAAVEDMWGLPVTDAARTLIDCISVMSEDDAGRLVDSQVDRSVTASELARQSSMGTQGAPALRRQLREAALYSASEPERLFARALAKRRLHMLANHPIGPYTCDFVDERSRTVVEVDGREFHSAPGVFRRDRRRQNWLQLRGWLVLRYAAADVYNAIDRCADEVVAVVRDRRRNR
ncbi:DUF559 domain-containing protein [Nocardia sp. NPDC051756]|uniref:DUF559 domain-containing protein n=1 Tax=Nocardia sp. NPDC051756 TaxID=3154751 RepID=UPI00341396BF